MSQTITITNPNKVIKTPENVNLSNTIDKAISNIQNIDPEAKADLVIFMNDTINNIANIDYETTTYINKNRNVLLNISKNLNQKQLQQAFNNILHAITLSEYQSHGFTRMIIKMGEEI